VIAAILTPTPDIVNQAIMAAPLIGLYLISRQPLPRPNKDILLDRNMSQGNTICSKKW